MELAGRFHRAQTAAMIMALREQGFDDVTPAFSAILPLIELEGSRQSDMARQAGLTKQAVGQLVRELAQRRYIELKRDPKDVRASLVTFTPRGLELRRCGLAVKVAMRQRASKLLGEARLAELESSLGKLLEASRPTAPHQRK